MRFTVQRAPSPVDDASPTGSADTVGDSSSRRDVSAVRRTSVGQQPTTGDDRRQLLGTFRRVDDERGSKAGVNDEKNDYAVPGVKGDPDGGNRSARDRRVLETMADRGRRFAGRQRQRVVDKDGLYSVTSQNVTERRRRYLVDIFTTLVDMRWRYIVAVFGATFIVSWTTFAVVWFSIAYAHGDCQHTDDDSWKPCISNVYDFHTALLFSIETQTTIGYGFRVIQPECTVSLFVLVLQSCCGVFVQSLMTGLIFSKLAQPKQRAHTIMFSRLAVVCRRDCEYQLMFRVGNMRRSHVISTSIRAILIKDRMTKEGETIPLCQYPLDLVTETCVSNSYVFLVWPATIVHRINSSSPLWDISAEQLLTEQFEIIVILEGIVESTGMTAQMRTSYLPCEILWAHRLTPLLTYQKDNGQCRIDYKRFHSVEPIAMPDCSAKTLAESQTVRQEGEDEGDVPSTSVNLLSAGKLTSRRRLSRGITLGSGGASVIRRVRSLRLTRHRARPSLRGAERVIVVDDVTSGADGKPEVDVQRSQQNGTAPHKPFISDCTNCVDCNSDGNKVIL